VPETKIDWILLSYTKEIKLICFGVVGTLVITYVDSETFSKSKFVSVLDIINVKNLPV